MTSKGQQRQGRNKFNLHKELSKMLQIPVAIDAEMLEVVRPEYFKPNPKSKHKPGKKGTEGKNRKIAL